MEYLSPEEIKQNDEIKTRLGKWISPTIRFGFSDYLVNKYISKDSFKLLDCGTASGEFAHIVKSLKPKGEVYGVDIEDYRTKKELFDGFYKVDLNIQKLPFADNSLDYITAWCVIPHLENPFNFIREANRVLKHGGLFVFSIINIISHGHRKHFYRTGEMPGFHERNNHIYLLTPTILKKTALKYFDLIGNEYLISPSIFKGLKGWGRKLLHKFFPNHMDKRWGAKVFYILKKKQ
jgi:ubiquinone/menaquinone biosynthesis C-methylase UbiE